MPLAGASGSSRSFLLPAPAPAMDAEARGPVSIASGGDTGGGRHGSRGGHQPAGGEERTSDVVAGVVPPVLPGPRCEPQEGADKTVARWGGPLPRRAGHAGRGPDKSAPRVLRHRIG